MLRRVREATLIYVPFKRFDYCAKSFSTFMLEDMMENADYILDEKRTKPKTPSLTMWMDNFNELAIYYYYMRKEYNNRSDKRRVFPEMPFSNPSPIYWENDQLFYISQKIILLRTKGKLFRHIFFVKNYDRWPKGGYFPSKYEGINQMYKNRKWIYHYEIFCKSKLENAEIFLNKNYGFIDNVKKVNPY